MEWYVFISLFKEITKKHVQFSDEESETQKI